MPRRVRGCRDRIYARQALISDICNFGYVRHASSIVLLSSKKQKNVKMTPKTHSSRPGISRFHLSRNLESDHLLWL